jgi:hypothetical protein
VPVQPGTRAKSRRSVRLQPDQPDQLGTPGQTPAGAEDAGFRPWHFFVLASLMAATAAVIMSRQARPEHLVLISLTIASAGLAAAGFYRMLAPLALSDASAFSEPLSERGRAALEREKALVLRSIKELEFDRAMGKLSPRDFEEMVARLRARAMSLIKELDEGESGYRALIERELAARLAHGKGMAREGVAPAPVAVAGQREPAPASPGAEGIESEAARPAACAGCGTQNDHDAAFCKRCGTRL